MHPPKSFNNQRFSITNKALTEYIEELLLSISYSQDSQSHVWINGESPVLTMFPNIVVWHWIIFLSNLELGFPFISVAFNYLHNLKSISIS